MMESVKQRRMEAYPGSSQPNIIVADDDPDVRSLLDVELRGWGYNVDCVADKTGLYEMLGVATPSMLILDLNFGDHDGLEIYSGLKEDGFVSPVLFLTGFGSIASAVTATKLGAVDFLEKPTDLHNLREIIDHTLGETNGKRQWPRPSNGHKSVEPLSDEGSQYRSDPSMLGCSPGLERVRELIAEVATTNATVLILGENGTGKELAAREIHRQSHRRFSTFVPVDLGALPPTLIESALFGHVKGAFTGAHADKPGSCEQAHQGTLFLDEIGELSLELQPKLMRFLQDQKVQPVGAARRQQVDVRIIAATNRDLGEMVEGKEFREDLFYRLNVFPIVVPPLRERREDIELLAQTFVRQAAERNSRPAVGFTPTALEVLTEYRWPGNVRQLENLAERLVIRCHGEEIGVDLLPSELLGGQPEHPNGQSKIGTIPSDDGLTPIQCVEKQAIVDALAKTNGHVARAAKLVGMGQATVYRKVKRYGISHR